MKFVYLILGIICLVATAILFFQLIVSSAMTVPFFDRYIEIKVFAIYLILLWFIAGVTLTLGIKGFLDSSSRIDDDFDL